MSDADRAGRIDLHYAAGEGRIDDVARALDRVANYDLHRFFRDDS